MLSAFVPMNFSRLEVLVLVTLLAVSAGLLWPRFSRVMNKIHQAKPDADFQFPLLGRRIGEFIWEVLFQVKVIRERPWPGLAHALVFWGFCAFALVTINHLATGFGFPFLSRSAFSRIPPLSGDEDLGLDTGKSRPNARRFLSGSTGATSPAISTAFVNERLAKRCGIPKLLRNAVLTANFEEAFDASGPACKGPSRWYRLNGAVR